MVKMFARRRIRSGTRAGRGRLAVMAGRSLRRADDAVSTIAGFAVAVAVYGVAFMAFMSWSATPQLQHNEAQDLGSRANSGIATILGSAGLTAQSGQAWFSDPDHITRFGLSVAGKPDQLDLDKMRNLTKGNITTDAVNNLLDYGEAKDALGLGNYDFHLRTYPLLPRLEDIDHPVRNLRVAYLGDFTQINGNNNPNYLVQFATESKDMGSYVFVNVTVTNNGTLDAVFQVAFSFDLRSGGISDTENTLLLGGNGTGSQKVGIKLYKMSSWDWGSHEKKVDVSISDVNQVVGSSSVDLSGIDMTAGTSSYSIIGADATKVHFKTSDKPQVSLSLFDGVGKNVKNVQVNVSAHDASGGLVYGWTGNTAQNDVTLTFPDTKPAGGYGLWANTTGNYAFNELDGFQVTDDPGSFQPSTGPSSYTESASSVTERSYLNDLVQGWHNTTYDVGGDVYPDIKTVMNNDLANNLSAGHYDALVVGSNVDQNAMTSAAAKNAVRDFVLGGGLLVVFGSDAQQVTWLQPLFHASLTTSGNGIGTPDPTHPILHTPEELSYTTYPDNGKAWELNSPDSAHFTNVLVRSGTQKQTDVLAVSKPGHFGNGSIVLGGWQPYNLTSPQDPWEAKRVLYNFLEQGLGALYVDFGPSIPSYAEVASASRLATADNPVVKGEQVLVRTVLYVFR